jgi:hypothetical protein
VLLLRSVTVIDPRDGTRSHGTDGDTISAVRPDIDPPAGTETVDLTGRYVIPGLNDRHAHPARRPAAGRGAGADADIRHQRLQQMAGSPPACSAAVPVTCRTASTRSPPRGIASVEHLGPGAGALGSVAGLHTVDGWSAAGADTTPRSCVRRWPGKDQSAEVSIPGPARPSS